MTWRSTNVFIAGSRRGARQARAPRDCFAASAQEIRVLAASGASRVMVAPGLLSARHIGSRSHQHRIRTQDF
jgi:hypothetical protein